MATAMDRIFGTRKQETMAVQQPAANPAVIANQPTGQSANGPAKEAPPLDAFKDIWNTAPKDPNAPPEDNSPIIQYDPAKINEAVGKMDFLSGIPSELMTKATTGDVTAFGQVVNTAVQKALAASSQLTATVVGSAIEKNNSRNSQQLPAQLREARIRDVRSDNPVLNHEAAAPMLDTLKRQFASKNPKATPEEVHRMAEDMLTTFADSLTANKQAAAAPKDRAADDFSAWG